MALRQLGSAAVNALGLRTQVWAGFAAAQRAYSSVLPNLKYAASHEWADAQGDVATIGISDHAQAELGDVVYVELPEVGKQLKKGDTFGVVESVKAASDVYAPVSGEVVETNQALADKPALLNTSPYADGWIIKIKLSDKSELGKLMSADAYQKECEKGH